MAINLEWFLVIASIEIMAIAGMALLVGYGIIRVALHGRKSLKTARQTQQATQNVADRPRYGFVPGKA